jgi:hypothetical protein
MVERHPRRSPSEVRVVGRVDGKQKIESGRNSTVECDGKSYHVQTQCSLRGAPVVESMVFQGGQVLVRFTASCEDVAQRHGFNGDDARHVVGLQHGDLIRKIRLGMLRDDEPDDAPVPHRAAGNALVHYRETGEPPVHYRETGEPPVPHDEPVRLEEPGDVEADPGPIDDQTVRDLFRDLRVAIAASQAREQKNGRRPWWRRVALRVRSSTPRS